MRKDKKLTAHNLEIKNKLKNLIKKMRRNPSAEALQEVTSALDKAVKTKYIHANKAARLKSRLSKLSEPVKTQTKKAVKKTTSKKR